MSGRPTMLLLAFSGLLALTSAAAVLPGPSARAIQRLDFMSFTLPAGEWQTESAPSYDGYTRPVPGRGFCRLTVHRVVPSRGSLASDAAADWEALIARRYPGAANHTTRTAPVSGTAWTFIQQTAVAKVEGTDMLLSVHTFTGHGQHMSLLFENTHQPFDDLVNQVIGGLHMSAPQVAGALASRAPEPQGRPTSLLGKWQRTASSFNSWGSGDVQGYTHWLYDFRADGTFTMASKTWPQGGMEILYRRESGSFLLEGEGFTLRPNQSVSERWSKRPGHLSDPDQLISRQANPLEAARYRFVFHYSSGIREWNLVLMTDRPTGRDGKFDGGTLFPNGWYYKQTLADATVESDVVATRP